MHFIPQNKCSQKDILAVKNSYCKVLESLRIEQNSIIYIVKASNESWKLLVLFDDQEIYWVTEQEINAKTNPNNALYSSFL